MIGAFSYGENYDKKNSSSACGAPKSCSWKILVGRNLIRNTFQQTGTRGCSGESEIQQQQQVAES